MKMIIINNHRIIHTMCHASSLWSQVHPIGRGNYTYNVPCIKSLEPGTPNRERELYIQCAMHQVSGARYTQQGEGIIHTMCHASSLWSQVYPIGRGNYTYNVPCSKSLEPGTPNRERELYIQCAMQQVSGARYTQQGEGIIHTMCLAASLRSQVHPIGRGNYASSLWSQVYPIGRGNYTYNVPCSKSLEPGTPNRERDKLLAPQARVARM